MDVLPLTQSIIDGANDRLGTDPTVISPDAYSFLSQGVPTFAGRVILITHQFVPDDQVYEITRVLHDNLDRIRRAHGSLRALSPVTMSQVGGVPPHPGAARFYQELESR